MSGANNGPTGGFWHTPLGVGVLTAILGAVITAAITPVIANSQGIFKNSDAVQPSVFASLSQAPAPVAPVSSSPRSPSPVSSHPTAPAPTLHARDYVLTEGLETDGLVRDSIPKNSPESQDSDAKFAACLGVPIAQVQTHAIDSADGPDLKSADELTYVNSHADVLPPAEVTRDRTVFGLAQAARCVGLLFFPMFQKEISGNGWSATLDSTHSMSAPAGATIAVRIAVTITAANGNYIPCTFDNIFIMSGRVETWIRVSQLNGTPDPILEQNLALQVAGKAARQ